MTEDEREALRNQKPLILNVSLDFQTALKLNEIFERDQTKIDKFVNEIIILVERRYNMHEMTIDEKRELLIDLINQLDEISLDELISEYLDF